MNKTFPMLSAITGIALGAFLLVFTVPAVAEGEPMTAEVAKRVEVYKHKLQEWAADPNIVAVAREANAKGAIAGMTNVKWQELPETDALVQQQVNNAAGKLIRKWGEDKLILMMDLRDAQGNLAASGRKSALYNAASRPAVRHALQGQVWVHDEITTGHGEHKKHVEMSAPVMDGGKVIGILHPNISAE